MTETTYGALIVVDMQNDFCAEGGAMQALGADISANKDVARRLPQFVQLVRGEGVPIVWLRQSTSSWVVSPAREAHAAAMGRSATTVASAGTWGAELIDAIRPLANDLVIDKPTYSGFVGTSLDKALRAQGIGRLLVCGTAANVCVDSTIRSAYMLDYDVTMVRDLVGWTQMELAKSAILNLERYFCSVRTSTQIVAELAAIPGPHV